MNWYPALKKYCGLFPAIPDSRFHWRLVEKRIQKALGLDKVVTAFLENGRWAGEGGSSPFGPSDNSTILRRFKKNRKGWLSPPIGRGNWLGLWPISSREGLEACFCLGNKKNGKSLNGDERAFMDLAVDRAGLYFETRRLWNSLEMADRQSAAGFMAQAMAHEIRNPLTAMGTMVQLLPRKKDDLKFMEEFNKVMDREIRHLTRLTESVLDFAKPNVEKADSVDLQAVVDQVVRLLSPLFEMKKTKLRVNNTGKLFLRGDSHQIQSLVMNLLQNAFQSAGPGGKVQLSSRLLRRGGGVKWVEFSVKDNGPGIPLENREIIFKPYFSTKSGGTGLGLAICRKIIEEHRGLLTIKSSSRKGSQFLVTLPVR